MGKVYINGMMGTGAIFRSNGKLGLVTCYDMGDRGPSSTDVIWEDGTTEHIPEHKHPKPEGVLLDWVDVNKNPLRQLRAWKKLQESADGR